MDTRLQAGGPIVYVDSSGKPYRAAVVKWWTHCGTEQPGCNLFWFGDAEGAAPVSATSVAHKTQGGRGNYWMWWDEAVEANLTPGPVPTSGPASGPPP